MRIALLLLALLGLTACADVQDQIAREAARDAVRPVLAQRFPGVPLEPATDCVIDNASAREILILARDAATGPTASTAEVVIDIVRRPETIRCLAEDGLPVLLGRL